MSTDRIEEPGRQAGANYLNLQLAKLGFDRRGSNAHLSRVSGIGDSIISKWRRALITPTYELFSQFLDALAPIAETMAVPFDRTEFMVRYGLIRRDESESDDVDELYMELLLIDRQAGRIDRDRQRVLREHVRLLIDATRKSLAERSTKPGTGRKVS